jgi:pimeloyl-ACP methyl ester carboxylesterase
MRQLAIMNKQRNFWPVCLGVHTFNFEEKLNELKMPVKLVYGMKDKVCPLESGLDWKQRCEDTTQVKVTGFPNARHFPIEEQEKNSIEHILEFIGNGKTMMKMAHA